MELERTTIVAKRNDEEGDDGDNDGDNDDGVGNTGTSRMAVLTTSVFLVGELAGTGVMALPYSVEQTGYIGIVLILVSCMVACYMGHILGQCWLIVQSRYEEYRGHVRHPYPTMAYVAFGEPGRIIFSCCSNFSMFGGVFILLILASQNIHSLLANIFDVDVKFCLIMVIVAAVVTPFTWFGTPKDFWVLAVGAALSTTLAVILSIVVIINDSTRLDLSNIKHSPIQIVNLFQSCGTILFATCGHYAFLTFQNDMKQPAKFGSSLIISYIGLAVLYMPIALAGYLVYGKHVTTNILLSLSPGPVSYVILILVTCHQFCAYVIILNPLLQHLEESLGSKKSFTWQRVLIRSLMGLAMLFVAETVPRFGTVMSLLGGSTNMVIALIGPPVIYVKLCHMSGEWPKIHIPIHTLTLFVEIVAVGIVIGVVSTYGNFLSLWGSSSLTLPCYVNSDVEGG